MKNRILVFLTALAIFGVSSAQTVNTVSYTQETSVFLNPERGFYHHTSSHDGVIDETTTSAYAQLTSSELDSYKAQGTSMVLRLFFIHEFYNSTSVSQTYLTKMQTDFDLLRTKGMKAIIRFAYSTNEAKKDLGVTVSRIQGHLTSLTPIIQANQDVILAAQIGFIGAYGEGYYTTNFGDLGQISASQWNDRSQVVQAWLDALPAGIQLLTRTPQQKAKYLEYIGQSTNAVTESESYNPSIAKARIGHHNDCILSSPDQLIQVFKIPKSSLSNLNSTTIKIGYRALKNGSLALSTTDSQLPSPSSDFEEYTLGSSSVSNQTPNWSSIPNVVDFTNGTLLEFKAADDASYIYIRVRMSGYVRITKDKYQLFINTDNNTSTGWIDGTAWSASGANHVIENGVLKAHTLSGNGFTFNTVQTLQPDSSYAPSFDDQGTFIQESDIDFMAEESKYVMVGGETCAPTSQTDCSSSLARMALHHYTFLNEIYHPTVLQGWSTNNCYSDFQKKLGYRLRLTSASFQSSVEVGKQLSVSLNITNDGFAAPSKLRKLNLVLKNTSTNAFYTVPFQGSAADIRKWQPGSRTVNETLTIPADLPTGTYALYLGLPDGNSSIATRADYAIRFANQSMWDATNGINNLNTTITVTSASSPSTPTIVIDGSTSDWSGVDNVGITGASSSIQTLKAYDDATNLYILATGTSLQSGYQLYIDADGKSWTGYTNGADYKIEGGKLYKNEWSDTWFEVLTFSGSQLVKNSTALELLIPKSNLYGIDEYVGLAYNDLNGSTVVGSLPVAGNPVTYNLLNPVSVARPAISITVDGASGDWAYINATATGGDIQVMKVYDSKQNIYILLKGALTATNSDYQLFFNTDNSAATGLVDNANWVAMGADYAIIGGLLYQHDPTTGNGVNGWGWTYQNLSVTTSFGSSNTVQEIIIPKNKFNNMAVGTTLTIGYRKLSSGSVVAKLPASGGMANYIIENPYVPNLQSLTISDDITNIFLTVQGGSITTNYKAFIDSDNNTATGYVDAQFWSTMGADYMIENGNFYRYNGVNQAWGWTSANTTLTVTNTQVNADLSERKITIQRAEFPSLTTSNVIKAGFANDLVADKLPTGSAMQSYTLTKAYIPALSSIALSDNATNIFITVQGSVLTTNFEAFINSDNNTSTGFIDATWSAMGADYMIQNGTLYSYSGTSNGWGWTSVQAGLQVNDSQVNADLKQREIIIPRSKLAALNTGNTIKGGYRSVVSGATSAAIPTTGSAMHSYNIANSYVADLQGISASDNSTDLVVTVTGGNLSSTYQVYINNDNVAASGYSDGTWTNTGIDYMIENGNLYSYSGTGSNWSWSSISGNVSVSNNTSGGVTTRTITITKSALSNTAATVKLGYRNLVSGSLSGKLPADNDMLSFTLTPSVQNIGETGTLTFSQANKDTWATKTLSRTYNNPVVIISPLSYNSSEPATVRVKNVTGNSFQYQIDEWDYLDGVHGSETVYYMVVEAGRYTLNGNVTLEAGTKSVNNKWSVTNFQAAFTATNVPLVLAQTMTYNGATAVTTRVRYISQSNFELKVQEEESNDYIPGRVRASETVGYVAINEGSGNIGYTYEADGTSRSYDNYWKKIWYNGTFSTPAIFAHMQTSYGNNTATLRYRSLASTNVSMMVEEEQSYDFEMEHTAEEIGYLVLGGTGVFQGTAAPVSGGRLGQAQELSDLLQEEGEILSVYPNPVEGDYLHVTSSEVISNLTVFNINGARIHRDEESGNEKTIYTGQWERGLYVIRIQQANGRVKSLKVLK